MHKELNQKTLIFVGFLFCLFFIIAFRNHFIGKNEVVPQDAKGLVNYIVLKSGVKAGLEYPELNWKMEDGHYAPLIGYGVNLGSNSEYSFNYPTNYYLDKGETIKLEKIFDSIFLRAGFKLNKENTWNNTESRDNSATVIYAGYELGEMKCLINLFSSTNPFGMIGCGIYDKIGDDLRKEFIGVVNDKNFPDFIVTVDKVIGKYAKGGAGSVDGSGYYWLAVKENGEWFIAHRGQDIPSCEIIDKYLIPPELYGNCGTDTGFRFSN